MGQRRRGFPTRSFLLSWFSLPLAALAALVVGAFLILAFGKNPIAGLAACAISRAAARPQGLVAAARRRDVRLDPPVP